MVVGEYDIFGVFLLLLSIVGFRYCWLGIRSPSRQIEKVERGESNEFWTSHSDRKRFIRRS